MGDEDANSRCKVFIGGLNVTTTKESLKSYFEQFGEIVDAVVMRDPTTKRSRGFGFVTYGDSKCLEECLKECPHTVDGRQVDAKRAIPRDETSPTITTSSSGPPPMLTKKVFLGGLSPDTTERDIEEVLETIGKVAEVIIQREKFTEKPRGFGFVLFESPESVDRLCQRRYIKIKDRDVEVKKAISQEEMRKEPSRGRSGGGQGGYRDNSYGGGGRDAYQSSYGRGGGGGGGVYPVAGYDYRGYPAGADYTRPDPYYGYPAGYDRNTAAAAAAAYPYANSYARSYDMAAYSMYGAAQAGMGVASYGQTPSNYGPARGYTAAPMGGGVTDYTKERGGAASRQTGYHPYRRN